MQAPMEATAASAEAAALAARMETGATVTSAAAAAQVPAIFWVALASVVRTQAMAVTKLAVAGRASAARFSATPAPSPFATVHSRAISSSAAWQAATVRRRVAMQAAQYSPSTAL